MTQDLRTLQHESLRGNGSPPVDSTVTGPVPAELQPEPPTSADMTDTAPQTLSHDTEQPTNDRDENRPMMDPSEEYYQRITTTVLTEQSPVSLGHGGV